MQMVIRGRNVSYNLESHWFTHIDFPLHFDPNGKTSGDYPLQDWAITDCLVLDFSDCGDNTAIVTGEMLEKANEKYKDEHFDSLLIRTGPRQKSGLEETTKIILGYLTVSDRGCPESGLKIITRR